MNYRELADVNIPRAKKMKCERPDNQLFPVRVLEREENRVKIHYVGYTSTHDEWREVSELEYLEGDAEDQESRESTPSQAAYQPHSLYRGLSAKVKQALMCGRKTSPVVRIVMPFDIVLFNGGLKVAGFLSRTFRKIQHYKIRNYCDLDGLLGRNWHYRGLNANGDYGKNTVEFYIFKSRPLIEYLPPSGTSDTIQCIKTDTGYTIAFCFVCKYGTMSTFGKDKDIFG